MLRLPADLQLKVISLAQAGEACSLTCRGLRHTLNSPDSIVRLYLDSYSPRRLPELLLVYCLLRNKRLRSWTQTENGAAIAVQIMLECAAVLRVFNQQQQEAVKAVQNAVSTGSLKSAVQPLQSQLPFAEHCLLPFCAQGGHVHLVKALLPLTHTPVLVDSVLHYVKTSAFLAAAAGGQTAVLSELLAANATSWACQLPGVSLTRTALDLAAQGGHLEAMKLLKTYVGQPNSTFLCAAADSGNGAAMEWALTFWCEQFNAVTPFGPPHVRQMHDALRVACQQGHLAVIRQLLRYLHAVRCHDCCVLALSYTCSTSNTEAMHCVLESPYLPQQLQRGGPKLLEQLVMVVASCLRIAIRIHSMPSLQLLLDALSSSTAALAPVRPLLAPEMPSVYDQAASAGDTSALQLLLTHLPEHYEGLGFTALEAALSEGHDGTAQFIRALLIMRGPDQGFTAAALSPEVNSNVARAARHGAFKVASSAGDVGKLQALLQQGPEGPNESDQLLMLRLAAAAGREEAVQMMLGEFGGGGRLEACLTAVCRGAVHAGQLSLLQALAADTSGALVQHLSSQPEALCEYLRAALLCGVVQVAAWLVGLAAQHQLLGLVSSTLQSLLTTSRWELWNTGVGKTAREAVTELLKTLADQAAAAAAAPPIAASGVSSAAHDDRVAVPDVRPAAAVSSVALTAEQAAQLLTPEVLSLLLHASAGDPTMLFTVVNAVSALGLASQQKQTAESKALDTAGVEISAANSRIEASEPATPSFATVSSTGSAAAAAEPSSPVGQSLRRQASRLGPCPRASAVLDTGFSKVAASHSPYAREGSEPVSLHYQPGGSWPTGILRPAVSDPAALSKALADQSSWRSLGCCEAPAGHEEGVGWLQGRGQGEGELIGSRSTSSSQERLVLERLHGALSEPLGEMLHSPVHQQGRRLQQQQQQHQQQQQVNLPVEQRQAMAGPKGVDCLQPHAQQKAGYLRSRESSEAGTCSKQQQSAGRNECQANGQQQQQRSSGVGSKAMRQLKQLTGQVEQLSVSTPSSPQHPYMVQYHKQLMLQNSLKRTSQPEYGTREQRQLRSVISLPAGKMPQHPYMQNYQQQLQQQTSAVSSPGTSPV